jgi:hypothetical protein
MNRSSTARPGTAAWEFILALPILLTLLALVLAVARAGLGAVAAPVEARRAAWADRANGTASHPLDPNHLSAGEDAVRREATRAVPGLPPGFPRTARASHTAPAAGTWDDRDLHLSDQKPWFHPWPEVTGRLALGSIPGMADLPEGLKPGAEAGRRERERVRQQRKELERKAAEFRTELAAAKEQLRQAREKLGTARRIEDRDARARAEAAARAEIQAAERRVRVAEENVDVAQEGLDSFPDI